MPLDDSGRGTGLVSFIVELYIVLVSCSSVLIDDGGNCGRWKFNGGNRIGGRGFLVCTRDSNKSCRDA